MKIGLFFLAFWSGIVFANIGYTEEELKALANIERQAAQTPLDSNTKHSIGSQNQKSLAFQEQMQRDALNWQSKLDPRLLQGAIDIPEPTENPNANPSGVMVFVSLTMPDSSLRALLRQSEQWQIPLVIRGVLPDGFPATAKRIQSLLKQPTGESINSGFAISPEWFQTFNVTEVPTIVAVKPGRCLPKQPCNADDFDIIKGNVSILDALDFLKDGDAKDVIHTVLSRGN
ncbi:type-F conjugative transfer system pilin assembly protein TrbC [Vibrio parahaemolyticus]|nr:type-F conjugative transfer system pilin assembly protein TrbC [Vibrio parahaemolyticus]MCR9653193.1 type-F conjugative transfer system pilin assembly protein TrbC [Vibrio parahaemolyticus]